MRLVKPFFVPQTGGLLSSNLPMSDPAWVSTTAYVTGNIVVYWVDTVYRRYEALSNNTNVLPTEAVTWRDLGPANQWAAFDRSIGTRSVAEVGQNSIFWEIQCSGVVDALALLRFTGLSVNIQVFDGAAVLPAFDQTYSMVDNAGVSNWFAYFFQEPTFKDTLTVLTLPTYVNPRIRITITGNASARPGVGLISLGKQFYVGRPQYGSSVSFTDFSLKETDAFGGFRVVERPFSDTVNLTVMIEKSKVDPLKKFLATYRATPLLVIGTDCYDSTTVYAFFRDFSIVLQHHNEAQCSIEFEGVT